MATIKLYKKSSRQPCYRLSYRDPLTAKWRQKLLHCSREEAERIRKKVEAEYTWYEANPDLKPGYATNTRSLSQAIKEFKTSKQGTVQPSTVDRYMVV